jgi:glycosyltransferase involved in cell wall biosynthesis
MISVITVNLNNLIGLKKTFESVINQYQSSYEFIIIDGGSKDGSVEFIKDNNLHLSYWISEKDKGVYHAMNKGLEQATGKYCIFLNSGDYFTNGNVLNDVHNQITGDEDLVYGLISWEDTHELWNPMENFNDFEIAFHSPIPHQATFFKVETLRKMNGYKENYKIISDWGIMLEMILSRKKIKKISILVSTCEKQGISFAYKNRILKERIKYLWNYAKFTLLKGILYQIRLKFK